MVCGFLERNGWKYDRNERRENRLVSGENYDVKSDATADSLGCFGLFGLVSAVYQSALNAMYKVNLLYLWWL